MLLIKLKCLRRLPSRIFFSSISPAGAAKVVTDKVISDTGSNTSKFFNYLFLILLPTKSVLTFKYEGFLHSF